MFCPTKLGSVSFFLTPVYIRPIVGTSYGLLTEKLNVLMISGFSNSRFTFIALTISAKLSS